ncbi:MAG: hypothetical protein H6815_07940 [Phycisphaeraceae bacterium]|nr:hypothetical protein [Phycisphaerales bacterium]MCB9860371.1 hypothetical protein [Phycisphaeraceae bacterium]
MSTALPTRELVLEKLRRCFIDKDEAAHAIEMLDRYGTKSWHRERDRVHLAILKECNGELERVGWLVEIACCDYRDVLAAAEYPEESRLPAGHVDLAAARQRDRQQYEKWLNGD